MPVRERLRHLFGGSDAQEDKAVDAVHREEEESVLEDSTTLVTHMDRASAATPVLTDLRLAQGQELLGPCRECSGYWTRERTRGQKPQTCPVCKRMGPPQ